jgi:hypothetical protein
MIRPLLSLERLGYESEGKVSYRYDKDSPEWEQMKYLDFIARVTSHIPDKGQVMVRYYGLYAGAWHLTRHFIPFPARRFHPMSFLLRLKGRQVN